MNLSRRTLLARAGLALGASVTGIPATAADEGALWSVYDLDQKRPRFQFRSRKGPIIRDGFAEFDDCPGGLILNCRFNLKDYTVGTNLKIVRKPEPQPDTFWKISVVGPTHVHHSSGPWEEGGFWDALDRIGPTCFEGDVVTIRSGGKCLPYSNEGSISLGVFRPSRHAGPGWLSQEYIRSLQA